MVNSFNTNFNNMLKLKKKSKKKLSTITSTSIITSSSKKSRKNSMSQKKSLKTNIERMCEEMDRLECLESSQKCHYVPIDRPPKYVKGCYAYKAKYTVTDSSIQKILREVILLENNFHSYQKTNQISSAKKSAILFKIEKDIDNLAKKISKILLQGVSIKGIKSITSKQYSLMNFKQKVEYLKKLCNKLLGNTAYPI